MRLIGATTDRTIQMFWVWKAPTRIMNPSITQKFIDQEMDRDPEAGPGEWLGIQGRCRGGV
jgi:hypothetical protein